ncbi:MAG: hypothetical protein Q9170_000495 [Blastenia crenularia]
MSLLRHVSNNVQARPTRYGWMAFDLPSTTIIMPYTLLWISAVAVTVTVLAEQLLLIVTVLVIVAHAEEEDVDDNVLEIEDDEGDDNDNEDEEEEEELLLVLVLLVGLLNSISWEELSQVRKEKEDDDVEVTLLLSEESAQGQGRNGSEWMTYEGLDAEIIVGCVVVVVDVVSWVVVVGNLKLNVSHNEQRISKETNVVGCVVVTVVGTLKRTLDRMRKGWLRKRT